MINGKSFSIRFVFLMVILVAIFLGTIYLPGRRVQYLINKLRSTGAMVYTTGNPYFQAIFPQFCEMFASLEGELTNEQVLALNQLRSIRRFHWKFPDHKSIRKIFQNRTIESIELRECRDEVSEALLVCQSLKSLKISGYDFHGYELGKLVGVSDLTTLELVETSTNDKSMKEVAKLVSLKNLTINLSEITDGSMQYISHLAIRELDVSETRLTDDCLKEISKIRGLRLFACRVTRITEEGLIENLTSPAKDSLQGMLVASLTILSNGECRLRNAFPRCSIGTNFTIHH
jgi:hypothetical protein